MTKLRPVRPKTEIEQVKEDIANFDDIPLTAEYDMNGKIIKLETTNTRLINYLKSKGFVEI